MSGVRYFQSRKRPGEMIGALHLSVAQARRALRRGDFPFDSPSIAEQFDEGKLPAGAIWLRMPRAGVGADLIEDAPDISGMLEIPGPLFLDDPEFLRHGMFDDAAGLGTAPAGFATARECLVWLDEACRRAGSRDKLLAWDGLEAARVALQASPDRVRNLPEIANDDIFRQGPEPGHDDGDGAEAPAVGGRPQLTVVHGGAGGEPDQQEPQERDGRDDGGRTGTDRSAPGSGTALRPLEDALSPARPDNHVLRGAVVLRSSPLRRAQDNIAAVELARGIVAEDRYASDEEREILERYVGWGGIPQLFEGKTAEFAELRARLQGLVSEEEYAAMSASTLNAHYTSVPIIEAIYEGLRAAGYDGAGHVLEPAAGVGHFLGAGGDRQSCAAVEKDGVSAMIAGLLYPRARIEHAPFEQVYLQPGSYDLAVGNPPFGSERLFDPHNRAVSSLSIHNYFLARCIDAIKPGGVAAFVVSRFFLDALTPKAREMIYQQADLVGAVRLPESAFQHNANTSVISDVLMFRKRMPGERPPAERPAWLRATSRMDTDSNVAYATTCYYDEHPENILGEVSFDGSHFQSSGYTVRGDIAPSKQAELGALVAEKLRELWAGDHYHPEAPRAEEVSQADLHDEGIAAALTPYQRVFGGYVRSTTTGNFYRVTPGPYGAIGTEQVNVKGASAKRLAGLIELRDALRALVNAEAHNVMPSEIMDLRQTLNARLDAFLEYFGGDLRARANTRLFRDDPSFHLVMSLVEDDEEQARAPILDHRVIYPAQPIEKVETLEDAVQCSFAERGQLDTEYCAALLGISEAGVVEKLYGKGLAYRDPVTLLPVWHEDYLSGDVRAALDVAKDAAERDLTYMVNVEALTAVQPPLVEAHDIFVQIGSPWVPSYLYQQFLRQTLSLGAVDVQHTAGRFFVTPYTEALRNDYQSSNYQTEEARRIKIFTQFGTSRMNAIEVAKHLLNSQPITVYDTIEGENGPRRVQNVEETLEANQCAENLKNAFADWIYDTPDRRSDIEAAYNSTFNGHRLRNYDGSHLISPSQQENSIELRQHQANFAYRAICERATLADHVVGAGKTFAAAVALRERKRLGLTTKGMVVVPNHLVSHWTQSFLRLYPDANILSMDPGSFAGDKRKAFLARVATGDWDAIICPHSSFSLIPLSGATQQVFLKEEIARLKAASNDPEMDISGFSVKQFERAAARMEKKLLDLSERKDQEDMISWEELGIDDLVIDEAHEFKNLHYVTSMRNVAGMGPVNGSKKAADMFEKARYMLSPTFARGGYVTFLTGTPISNTVAEMYHMMRYLDNDHLTAMGLTTFDAWAKTFAEVREDWEIDLTGNRFVRKARFARFANLRELSTAYRRFADVVLKQDLEAFAEEGKMGDWAIPKLKDDRPTDIILERSPELAEEIENIVERMDTIKNSNVDPAIDNPLKCLTDAKLAALDMRIRFPEVARDPNCKSVSAATEIARIYHDTADVRGVQVAFCDLSTPREFADDERVEREALAKRAETGDAGAAEELLRRRTACPDESVGSYRFDVYNDLKAELVARGVPADEIRFIHEAKNSTQKERMFRACQAGKVRVLVGSTRRMGTGMNIQDRLVALHHIDAPWRPADLEQREGRILRQGNQLLVDSPDFRVELLRYATSRTADPKIWQGLETKQRFIEQLRSGNVNGGEMEDIAEQAMSYAEMKAQSAGNPLVLEEVQLRQRVDELSRARRMHMRQQHQAQDLASTLEGHEVRAAAQVSALECDMEHFQEHEEEVLVPMREGRLADPEDGFLWTDDDSRKQAFSYIRDRFRAARTRVDTLSRMMSREEETAEVGTYRGRPLRVTSVAPQAYKHARVEFSLSMPSGDDLVYAYYDGRDLLEFSPAGLIARFRNHIKALPGMIESIRGNIPKNEQARREALELSQQEFDQEEGLQRCRDRMEEVQRILASDEASARVTAQQEAKEERQPEPVL